MRSHDEAILVLGPYDRHAKLLREDLQIEVSTRRGNLRLKGADESVQEARRRIDHLLGKSRKGRELGVNDIEAILLGHDSPTFGATSPAPSSRAPSSHRPAPRANVGAGDRAQHGGHHPASHAAHHGASHGTHHGDHDGHEGHRARPPAAWSPALMLHSSPIVPRTENQRRYLEHLERTALVFGVGPAGTGKTYLAVAAAVRALRSGQCRRVVITRPVVEAGERLGFLPGDLQAKLNPYTRPIYDAFYDMLGFEDVHRLEESGVIEVAPLAFMRGRTLAHAFAILDEGQNTTIAQMKMFLTRLGEGSRMVVTGDPSQSDLEGHQRSGLNDAVGRLRGFQDIGVVEFGREDIVRHPLVEQIVRAYEAPPRAPRDPERGA